MDISLASFSVLLIEDKCDWTVRRSELGWELERQDEVGEVEVL